MTARGFFSFFIIILFFIQIRMISFVQSMDKPQVLDIFLFMAPILSFITLIVLIKKRSVFFNSIYALLFLITMFCVFHVLGKIYHSNHIWLLSVVLMLFVNFEKDLFSGRNQFIIRSIQVYTLSTYFISGLWKLRDYFTSQAVSFNTLPLEYYAVTFVTEGRPASIVSNSMNQIFMQNLIVVGFYIIILFQLSCIVPLIKVKWMSFFGVLIGFFHIFNGLFFGHWFTEAILASTFFLIFYESMRPHEIE